MSRRCSNEKVNQETPTEAKGPTKRVLEGDADFESYPGFQKRLKVSLKPVDVTPYLKNNPEIILCTDHKKGILKKQSLDKFSLKCSVNLFRDNLGKIKNSFLKKPDDSVSPNTSQLDFQCNITDKLHPNDSIDSLNNSKSKKRVSFSEHVTVIEMREYHKCKKCPRIFYSRKTLKSHSRKMHKRNHQYLCGYCNKSFLDRMFFKTHIKMHCDVCECLFPSRAKCLEHKSTMCRILHKCKTCELSFFKQKHLRDHSYDHIGMYYVCDYCKENFATKCALAHHIKYLHSKRRPKSLYEMISFGAERLYLCNFCDESSVDRDLIEKHVIALPDLSNRIIKGRKDYYFCDQCKKNFDTEKEMLVHKWTHFLKTGDKSDAQKSFKNTDEKFPDRHNDSVSMSKTSDDDLNDNGSQKSSASLDNDDSNDSDSILYTDKDSDTLPSLDKDDSLDSEVSILSIEKSSENSEMTKSNTDKNFDSQPSLDTDESQDSEISILNTGKKSESLTKTFGTENSQDFEMRNTNTKKKSDLQLSLDADDSQNCEKSISYTEKNSENLPNNTDTDNSQDFEMINSNTENNLDSQPSLDVEDTQDSEKSTSNTEKNSAFVVKISDADDDSQDFDMSILERKRRSKPKSLLAAILLDPKTPLKTAVTEVEAKPKSWLEKMLSTPPVEPSVDKLRIPYKTKYKLNEIPEHMLKPRVVLKKMTMHDLLTSKVSLTNRCSIKKSSFPNVNPQLSMLQLLQKSDSQVTGDTNIATNNNFSSLKVLPAVGEDVAHKATHTTKDIVHATMGAEGIDINNSTKAPEHRIVDATEERLIADYNKFCSGQSTKAVVNKRSKKTLISKHQCMNCDRYFSNAYGLRRHINDQHYDYESLQCRMCEETFAWPSLLHSHKCIRFKHPEMPFKDARPEIHFENLNEIGEEIPIDPERTNYEVDFEIPEPIVSNDAQNSFVQPQIVHNSFLQPEIVQNGFVHPQNSQNSFVQPIGQNGFAQNMHTSTPRYNSGLQRRYSLMPSPILPDIHAPNGQNISLLQQHLTANDPVQPLLQNDLIQINEPDFLPIPNGFNSVPIMPSVNNSAQIPTVANNHVHSIAQNDIVQYPNANSNPIEQLKNLGYKVTIQEVPIEF